MRMANCGTAGCAGSRRRSRRTARRRHRKRRSRNRRTRRSPERLALRPVHARLRMNTGPARRPAPPIQYRAASNRGRQTGMQYLHTMVRVSDLDQSLDFYCNKLGLKEMRRYESEKGRFTLVYLAAPDDLERAKRDEAPFVELTYNWDPEEYKGGRNFGHLAYRV